MDRRVMLLPSIPTVDGKDARILTLPYPASGEPAGFVLVPVPEMDMTSTETITTTSTTETTTIESKLHIHSRLLMIQQIEGPFKSWAIDNYIIADGSLYVATPYDPLFLLAPILDTHRQKTDESAGRFMQWSDLTSSEDFPDLHFCQPQS
ncbi:hypothetical protein BASA83_002352 [Batrachochytrium salamandrivorans]|nr:hypothetical protein BASA83_002352 [Batrachochytrium salamandrivorans]